MTIRPVAFTGCYLLGTLILAVLFALDETYLGSFFSTWHVEFGLVPVLWFTYGKKLDLPEYTLGLLIALLVFVVSAYVCLPLFHPSFDDVSWLGTTAHSTIFVTSMVITFLLYRRFNVRTQEDKS